MICRLHNPAIMAHQIFHAPLNRCDLAHQPHQVRIRVQNHQVWRLFFGTACPPQSTDVDPLALKGVIPLRQHRAPQNGLKYHGTHSGNTCRGLINAGCWPIGHQTFLINDDRHRPRCNQVITVNVCAAQQVLAKQQMPAGAKERRNLCRITAGRRYGFPAPAI